MSSAERSPTSRALFVVTLSTLVIAGCNCGESGTADGGMGGGAPTGGGAATGGGASTGGGGANAAGGGASTGAPSSFQEAVFVIGQRNLNSNTLGTQPGPGNFTGITGTSGDPAVSGTTLYLSDRTWNRVLGFRTVPTENNPQADFVLGQTNFGATAAGTSPTTLRGPGWLHAADGKLLISDALNRRVLIFNSAPTTSGAAADVVVGQADFASMAQACSAAGLTLPDGLSGAGGKLIVADAASNRVLIWNTIPSTNGAPADLVLGQPDFTTCSAPVTPSATSLERPHGVWSDGQRLVVIDGDANRALIWNTFPTANRQPADLVLGQPDFVSGAVVDPPTASSLNSPYAVTSDGTRLYIGSWNDMRILIWNTFPTVSNQPANAVLGQRDFAGRTENDDDQDGRQDSTPSARTLRPARGLALAGSNRLVANDSLNWRYLIYQW